MPAWVLHPPVEPVAAYFKWLVLSKHVIAGTRQLVRQRLDRDNPVACTFLALLKASFLGARADGNVGRLDECPRQVPVPVLRVAFAFLPAVAFPPAIHAAAVRTEIAHICEPRNVSGFQHDHGCRSEEHTS